MLGSGLHYGNDQNDFDPDEINKKLEDSLIRWRSLRKASTGRLTLGKFQNKLQQHLVPDKDQMLQKNAQLMNQLTEIEERIKSNTTYLWVTLTEMKACLEYEKNDQKVRTALSKQRWKHKISKEFSPWLESLNQLLREETQIEQSVEVRLKECRSVTGLPIPTVTINSEQKSLVQ